MIPHPAPFLPGRYILRDALGNVVRGEDAMPVIFESEEEARQWMAA